MKQIGRWFRLSFGFFLPGLFLLNIALLGGCAVTEEAQKVQNLTMITTLDKADRRYFSDYQIFYLGQSSRPTALLMIPLQSKFAFQSGAWQAAGGSGASLVKDALQRGNGVTEIRQKAAGDLLGYLVAMPGSQISFFIDPKEKFFAQEGTGTASGSLPSVLFPPTPPPPQSAPPY